MESTLKEDRSRICFPEAEAAPRQPAIVQGGTNVENDLLSRGVRDDLVEVLVIQLAQDLCFDHRVNIREIYDDTVAIELTPDLNL